MTSSGYIIEVIPFAQIDRIESMWEQLIRSNASHSTYFSSYYDTFTFVVRKQFLREKEGDGSKITTWIAQSPTGEDVAFCTINYQEAHHTGEIEMLYVDPACRGAGLGTALMGKAMELFGQQGITDLKLCVTYGNEAALRLYQRFGFFPFTVDCMYQPQ